MTFKNQQVLRDVTWEVKKGERVGLVGERLVFLCLLVVSASMASKSQ